VLHVRIVSPSDRTDVVVDLVRSDPATANVSVLRGAAIDPAGDLVLFDVAREGVNDVIVTLRELGLHHDGSIAIEHVDVSVSDAAAAAERRAPGEPGDAAVWEEVDARVRDESVLTTSFLVFMSIAALIAAVGLLEDSQILIVGAMVVGPEFGPLAGLAVGILKRRARRIRLALTTILLGFAMAIAAAWLGTVVADAGDLVPDAFSPHTQDLTGFIVDPSVLSAVIAFLAGVAGMLSLTEAKAGALIGVLISVTTIPAAAAIGVSAALGYWDDAGGAAMQLGINVTAIVTAGVLTLWVQREAWERFRPRSRRTGDTGSPPPGR
jgi:uncharacterized hydrophobic protein (TIGR00271 family)